MKIIVKNKKKNFRLRLPTRLVLNSLSAWILQRGISKNSDTVVRVKTKDLRRFFREIRRMKKINPEWKAVYIERKDGSMIDIEL